MLLFALYAIPKLDLQIGLVNHFARPRYGKLVCQTILPNHFARPRFA
jgi:hypothetical protein